MGAVRGYSACSCRYWCLPFTLSGETCRCRFCARRWPGAAIGRWQSVIMSQEELFAVDVFWSAIARIFAAVFASVFAATVVRVRAGRVVRLSRGHRVGFAAGALFCWPGRVRRAGKRMFPHMDRFFPQSRDFPKASGHACGPGTRNGEGLAGMGGMGYSRTLSGHRPDPRPCGRRALCPSAPLQRH